MPKDYVLELRVNVIIVQVLGKTKCLFGTGSLRARETPRTETILSSMYVFWILWVRI